MKNDIHGVQMIFIGSKKIISAEAEALLLRVVMAGKTFVGKSFICPLPSNLTKRCFFEHQKKPTCKKNFGGTQVNPKINNQKKRKILKTYTPPTHEPAGNDKRTDFVSKFRGGKCPLNLGGK